MDNETQAQAVALLADQIANELAEMAARLIAERLGAVAFVEDGEDENAFQPTPTLH